MSILNKIIDNKVIAVIRSTTSDDLSSFIDVIVESGINSIEITLTTPNALSIIKQLRHNYVQACNRRKGGTVHVRRSGTAHVSDAHQFVQTSQRR